MVQILSLCLSFVSETLLETNRHEVEKQLFAITVQSVK
jgi:hypothetical protein